MSTYNFSHIIHHSTTKPTEDEVGRVVNKYRKKTLKYCIVLGKRPLALTGWGGPLHGNLLERLSYLLASATPTS